MDLLKEPPKHSYYGLETQFVAPAGANIGNGWETRSSEALPIRIHAVPLTGPGNGGIQQAHQTPGGATLW